MKVLILGFDGASPKLIDKWNDFLPTFKMFKQRGIFGQTIPPVPAQTPVAWTTFMTGKNPGKHGIFSFAMRKARTYEREIIHPAMLKSETFWRILSDNGKKVGVINVPMSDVENLNGFVIPGFLSKTEGTPYPDSVKTKVQRNLGIERLVGDVETEILKSVKSEPDLFFESVNQVTDQTAQISQYLFQEENWDFFITVFMGTDRIQHFFWKYVDPTHQTYEKNRFTQLVKEYYIKIDGIVKSFLDHIDENTLMIVLSDHGFCPVHKEVFVNNYLEELGFLKTRNEKIDLENSKAVSYGYGDIWLNVEDREPHGLLKLGEEYETTRNAIIEGLRNLRVNGENPFKDVKKREEIYWGSYLDNGPDLLAIFKPGWQAARRPAIIRKQPSGIYVNEEPRWSGGHDGAHDPVDVPGIFGLIGEGITNQRNLKVNLWDLAPTILQLMNVPVPANMDGKPLRL
ncbi:alkaline phosphatase family protein [Candidatus Bathyarchaeota archaeon]|nr:alkaline phosphatase family protein [Candidatus Bathyarchaeota archaeon]